VLARHYTDFSPEKLKGIYETANIQLTRDLNTASLGTE
jgi:hypothetical protein